MSATSTTASTERANLAEQRTGPSTPSLPESFRSISIPRGVGAVRKFLAFAGPGFLIAVGYMDPGNWATDIAGGARYGYTLLSVVLLANVMAIVMQALAVRLGVVTGRDLAQACREQYGRRAGITLWALAEVLLLKR